MIEQGQKMGITTWDDTSRFGLSLTLGGGEVKLIDLARVYATIAAGGKRPEMQSITEVKDYKGKILERGDPFGLTKAVEVVDPRVAFMITDILKDILTYSKVIKTQKTFVKQLRDLSDLKIIACAVSAKANYIVTGDKDLLVLGKFKQTEIVTARFFLEAIL